MLNIMIDIETLGTSPDAAIISIGAAAVNPEGELVGKFHVYTEECPSGKATMSQETVMWWLLQDKEAQDLQTKALRQPLPIALGQLSGFFGRFDNQGIYVWGNGVGFDNVILRRAYERNALKAPWSYRQDRCYRTLAAMFPDVKASEFMGTKHDALSDAMNQAKHLWEILKKIG